MVVVTWMRVKAEGGGSERWGGGGGGGGTGFSHVFQPKARTPKHFLTPESVVSSVRVCVWAYVQGVSLVSGTCYSTFSVHNGILAITWWVIS